jgi:hypothetical protein
VQALIVPSLLAHEIVLLIGEVALDQKFSREVVVARELRDVALDTYRGCSAVPTMLAVAVAH